MNEIKKEANRTLENKFKTIIFEYFLTDDIRILNRKESENKIPRQTHF